MQASPADRIAMLQDTRLSDTAVRLGLYLEALGVGWHEVPPDTFSLAAHGFPSRDTVAKHLRQLQLAGYVERRAGGRGHSDYFRFSFSSGKKPGPKPLPPAKNPDVNVTSGENAGPIGPHTCDDESVRRSEKEVGVSPSLGSPVPIAPDADRAIGQYAEVFAGCRGALRDYLAARVQPPRQYAYVQSVAGWFNGLRPGMWRMPNGDSLPPDRRAGVLAVALNELAAADEKPMKRPVGDPGNLMTKLDIVLKQEATRNERRNGGNGKNHRGRAAGEVGGEAPGAGGGGSPQASRRRRGFGT